MRLFLLLVLVALMALPGIASADCTGPAGREGTMDYFNGDKMFKFCNGTDWIGMAGNSVTAPLLTRCTNANSNGDGIDDKIPCVQAAANVGVAYGMVVGTTSYRALSCQRAVIAGAGQGISGAFLNYTAGAWGVWVGGNSFDPCADGTTIVIALPTP